jgi:hypothetical protein
MFSAAIRLESGVTRNLVRSVKLTVEEPAKPAFVLDELQTRQIADSLEDPPHKMMWNMNLWMETGLVRRAPFDGSALIGKPAGSS